MTKRAWAVLLLLLLLGAFPFMTVLPAQVAAMRLAGLSLLWWYAGVVAPLLACLVAVLLLPEGSPRPRPE